MLLREKHGEDDVEPLILHAHTNMRNKKGVGVSVNALAGW